MNKMLIPLILSLIIFSLGCCIPVFAADVSAKTAPATAITEMVTVPVGSEASRKASAEIAARKDYTTEQNLPLQDRIIRAAILPIADFMKAYYDLTGQLPQL